MTEIIVNGKRLTVESADDTPLLWVLRDELRLAGTRFGCGIGLCGCCTVHVDGAAMRSCGISVGDAANRSITTIEHLSKDGLHPLQQAWIDLDVPQCGYCQSGQLMQAAALLIEKPRPTDAEIDEAMSGNLCRCGTYLRIRAAIKLVAFGEEASR
jgi:aerobic-type carbon monoxide dehydrogenase small subunit (CoxS/CutS family)